MISNNMDFNKLLWDFDSVMSLKHEREETPPNRRQESSVHPDHLNRNFGARIFFRRAYGVRLPRSVFLRLAYLLRPV